MAIQQLFSALAFAAALGLLAGGHLGSVGWIAVGTMLLGTALLSGLLAGHGWELLPALAALLPLFNGGLVIGLLLRRAGRQPSA